MNKKYFLSALILSIMPCINLLASDTVKVQTFIFDSIQTRRAIWKFPDNPDEYRKILMMYTLKCDDMTVHDNYRCGEWDYLTYNLLHLPTGKWDSTKRETPLYTLGSNGADTLRASSKKTWNIYNYSRKYVNSATIISEKKYEFGPSDKSLSNPGKKGRIQMHLSRAEIKAAGFKEEIKKLRLLFENKDIKLKNFMIRMASTPAQKGEIVNEKLDTLFYADIITKEEMDFYFIKSFKFKTLMNAVIDISYEAGAEAPVFKSSGDTCFAAFGEDNYLAFDGKNDFVRLGQFDELNNVQQFTYELWLKIDEWEQWNSIIGKGDRTVLSTGPAKGSLYGIVRDRNTNHGSVQNAINMSEWTHIAMVYDGAQKLNSDRLILYINGVRKNLDFRGYIPTITTPTTLPLNLSTNLAAGAFKGAANEVRVWSKALSSTEISNWMNRELTSSHPSYSKLLAYYPVLNEEPHSLKNMKQNGENGTLAGEPVVMPISPSELSSFAVSYSAPYYALYEGNFTTELTEEKWQDSIESKVISLIKWKIENRLPVIDEIQNFYAAGWNYVYDETGKAVDSSYNAADKEFYNSKLTYYEAPFEVKYDLEIGRFITPYGINLDLGPEGFTWVYDVTDYAPYLKGEVEFSAGNWQELLDVQFLFIKGTPPRKVIELNDVWKPMGVFSYKSLSENTAFPEVEIPLNSAAKQFKIKSRITGHGHNSNDGSYPHCCEWKENTHYLKINGEQKFDWKIYRYDCAWNPVYPQGGTWPGAREGWCPGDIVPNFDYELDITNGESPESVKIDYSITPVPTNNQGMGNGNYVMSLQLVQYGSASHNVDAEIYNIPAPNNARLYSRFNPICAPPVLSIRNNGVANISKIEVEYGVKGGTQLKQTLDVNLKPNEMKDFELLVPDSKFWVGDGSNTFEARITKVDGTADQYADNDKGITKYNMPDAYTGNVVFHLRTNARPEDFTYRIISINGDVVLDRSAMGSFRDYIDTLKLAPGCYTLELLDRNQLGLSYWAYTQQGDGFFRIEDDKGRIIKNFNPDFGAGIVYSFNFGDWTYVQDDNINNLLEAYPNPAKDQVNIAMNYNAGPAEINVYDEAGRVIYSGEQNINEGFKLKLELEKFAAGAYTITVRTAERVYARSFVKE